MESYATRLAALNDRIKADQAEIARLIAPLSQSIREADVARDQLLQEAMAEMAGFKVGERVRAIGASTIYIVDRFFSSPWLTLPGGAPALPAVREQVTARLRNIRKDGTPGRILTIVEASRLVRPRRT